MTSELIASNYPHRGELEGLPRLKKAGAALAASLQSAKPVRHGKGERRNRRAQVQRLLERAAGDPEGENAAWLLDNFRLIVGAEKESREFSYHLSQYPWANEPTGVAAPRVCLLARAYLDRVSHRFSEQGLAAFLEGYQDVEALNSVEIWGLQQALQLELIDRLNQSAPVAWPILLTALRKAGEADWKDVFESASYTHRILARDPAGAYLRMDFESRDGYRHTIAGLAKHSLLTEPEIAEAAIELSLDAAGTSDGSRSAIRRTHAGYYLVDKGRARLDAIIDYRPPVREVVTRFILRYPTAFYLTGIEVLTLCIVFGILSRLEMVAAALAGLALLIVPASQAAVDLINSLTTSLIPPRALPKLDFSEGIPDDCATMVAVPTLLLDEAQVHDLVLDLEIRFLANRHPNLHFALLTDLPDSDHPVGAQDLLVDLCVRRIEGLNQRYKVEGRAPFYLFHRDRIHNSTQGRWMGWERKRGKLLDLNQLLRGGFDAFPVKVGDLAVLPQIRYVITLDSDTQLPMDAAARLIGTIAHPLNCAVVDPATRMVVEGYGILQPRIGISVRSASRSRLAALYSGQTGFDIYTRAVSDAYQDLFGEGIFTGKGIYEVDTFREALEQRFPENALLSHDLIEGAYARAALASDIELIDDYPSHFSAYSRRKHRWVRGDWQILRWIYSWVPDFRGRMIRNPIALISQWKILDNLRRSLVEPGALLLLLSGWLWLPGRAASWTALVVAMWFVPAVAGLLFALLRIPRRWRGVPAWARDAARAFRENASVALCNLIFLLHQGLISMDAVVRSVARVFFTRRNLLEWETAAEAEVAQRSIALVDSYLEWTPRIAAAIAVAVCLIRPTALPVAAPFLVMWMASRGFSNWLNRHPRSGHSNLSKDDVQLLRDSADRTWRFFHDWSSAATNWLIPDSVRENGGMEPRLSPTNLGMLLNARIAAVHLGVMPLAEFVFETRQTLDRVLALEKYRGHVLNWYDINSLQPLAPLFVSSVDSGNLAASLWTLKQAALAFACESTGKRGVTTELGEELRAIAEISDRLVSEMDFRFLYRRRAKALSVGYDLSTERLEDASYNLLASEARMASFVAIAKGDIPQECWFKLGRSHTLCSGERVLLSWSGTMFEYLMPSLWMWHYRDTLIDQSMRAAVRAHREYGRRKGIPWGISESAFLSEANGDYGYAPFGIPGLATQRSNKKMLVISPYSTFLAGAVDPAGAAENLARMREFGWFGRYGFYESIDYSRAGGEAVRMWMAHHQGMSLLAIVNLLFQNPIRQYFHAEPQVRATELLLHERVSAAALAEVEGVTLPELKPVLA